MPGEKRGKIKSQIEMTTVVEMPYTDINQVLLTGIFSSPKGRKILRNRNTKNPKRKEISQRAMTEEGNMNGRFSQMEKIPTILGKALRFSLVSCSLTVLS
jgi:hypothetical protein